MVPYGVRPYGTAITVYEEKMNSDVPEQLFVNPQSKPVKLNKPIYVVLDKNNNHSLYKQHLGKEVM